MRIKQKLINSILVGTLLAPMPLQTVFAGTGVVYLSPGSSSLQSGSSETLSLRINPGTTVDGVQATVSFNASSLRLNSVDTSGSPFSAQLQKTVGTSSFTVALGNLSGGVSTDSLIATFNVTALTSSGSATLSVTGANATSGGSYTNPSASGATIAFTAPLAPTPTPAPTPPPTSGSTGATSTKTTTTSASTTASSGGATVVTPLAAPKLTAKATAGMTSITLSVTSDRAIDLYARYGTNATDLSSQTPSAVQQTKASLVLGVGTPLTPGTTYYYQIVGVDPDGAQTKLPVQKLKTKGYTISVTVFGKDDKPLANHKVSLHSDVQTVTTDSNGVATFTDVAPGIHHLVYDVDGKSYSAVVYVENALASQPAASTKASESTQTAAVILPVSAVQATPVAAIVIGFLGLVIVAIAGVLLYDVRLIHTLRHHVVGETKTTAKTSEE